MTDELREAIEKAEGHTLGPWTVECNANYGYQVWGKLDSYNSIRVAICGYADTFDKANAFLIAAAPNLLSALRAAEEEIARLRERIALSDDLKKDWP